MTPLSPVGGHIGHDLGSTPGSGVAGDHHRHAEMGIPVRPPWGWTCLGASAPVGVIRNQVDPCARDVRARGFLLRVPNYF